ncbi:Aste57867_21870 [Aphanomyces stellatus]|uniref:Aste57867_21870 protein n=1 Tax=Aphanomyces stellatus TaxID=120398 RepID=A0A485LKR6_9STRA|nr:hypothetical protein As57867_021801 [Aphanomyces stellatus]VFT98538.1 Aste57867_21870 [Aphanomyces stellatus]
MSSSPSKTKRAATAGTDSPSKRPCSAASVLTNPALAGSIADFSANCLTLCPELYDVFEVPGDQPFAFDEDDDEYLKGYKRLIGKHVVNGYVDHEDDLSKDDLVSRAKASVADPHALYRALEIRQKLGEFAALVKTHHDAAAGLDQFDFIVLRPILFAPESREDSSATTWGREDFEKIYGTDDIDFHDTGVAGMPLGLLWHYRHMEDGGECKFCAAAEGTEENETMENEGEDEWSEAWTNWASEKGLDRDTLGKYRGTAYRALAYQSDTHGPFCTNVVRPLKAYLDNHLTDVKLVTTDFLDTGDETIGSVFLGGLTPDGYLAGLAIAFFEC